MVFMNKLSVSVVIPAHNEEKYIAKTIIIKLKTPANAA